MTQTILVVEDDPALLRGLKDNLEFDGFTVLLAPDGPTGLRHALHAKPDLMLLDIMLPGLNGYEICRLLRKQGLDFPIIMLTAKGQEADVVLGLNLGADDYVTKPFGIQELLARVHAFLRRTHGPRGTTFRFGPFLLDRSARTLTRNNRPIDLTPKEFAVLDLLTSRTGRALTRDDILRQVWGMDVFVTRRSVDRCITTLRAKIETDPAHPRYIQTIREIGYRFDGDGG